jgi:hypothetical protein
MRQHILPIYSYFNKANYKKKKKNHGAKTKTPFEAIFKSRKLKVNNIILLYKNNAKTNKIFLQCHFFSTQRYKRYFTMQIKRKRQKKPLAEDHILSNLKGKRVFSLCIINLNDSFALDQFSNDIWIP